MTAKAKVQGWALWRWWVGGGGGEREEGGERGRGREPTHPPTQPRIEGLRVWKGGGEEGVWCVWEEGRGGGVGEGCEIIAYELLPGG